jgi:large subunit ribosomal protein L14e
MEREILLSLGRVVYINFGQLAGKIAVVVDIVNGTRVVIDGPGLGVERQMISNKRLTLTRFRIPGVGKAEKQSSLQKKITDFKLTERFNATGLGKRIQKQKRRLELTDFERFKVMTLKKKLGKLVRTHVNKNRKAIVGKAK